MVISGISSYYADATKSALRRALVRPERVFVVLALTAGMYMVFVTAPFQAPDEGNHFFRAYQIGEGRLRSIRVGGQVGGWLPRDVLSAGESFTDVPFHPDRKIDTALLRRLLFSRPVHDGERIFVGFPNTALYPPVVYLPQAAGIAVARFLGLSVLAGTYAGRLLSLFCYIWLVRLAVRTTPICKWVIVLVALMPMPLFLAASLSADTLINGTAILFTALVLRAAMGEKGRLYRVDALAIAGLGVILSMSKLVYASFSALVALIPSPRFGGHRYKAAYCGGVIAAALAAAMLWGLETRKIYVDLKDADCGRQLILILTEPGAFARTLLNTVKFYGFSIIKMFVGLLGWLDTKLPTWISITYPLALVAAAFMDPGEGRPLGAWQKAWIGVICLIGLLLMATALYLIANKPGAPVIEGLQGRYLIPFALPALLLVHNGILPRKGRLPLGAVLTVYSAAVLVTTCLKVYMRYYG